MKVFFHKYFLKRYAKSSSKVKDKFDMQLKFFYENRHDKKLNDHKLHGKYASYRSINVTGDIRAVYREVGAKIDDVVFIDIGTHGELYS